MLCALRAGKKLVDLQQGVSHFSLIFLWLGTVQMPSRGGKVLQSLLKMVLHLKGKDRGSKVSWLFLGSFCASFWDQRYFIEGNIREQSSSTGAVQCG